MSYHPMIDKFVQMSNDDLIQEAKSLYESIYTVGCFGMFDLVLFDFVTRELERRGYVLVQTIEAFEIDEKPTEEGG
jgi:hypothetical protein